MNQGQTPVTLTVSRHVFSRGDVYAGSFTRVDTINFFDTDSQLGV